MLTRLNVILIICNHEFDGMCVVALAPATITMSEATFHPFVMRILMRVGFL